MKPKRKAVKGWDDLSNIERAILVLAEHIEFCPYNNYKVQIEVMNELGYKKLIKGNKEK